MREKRATRSNDENAVESEGGGIQKKPPPTGKKIKLEAKKK
jgi:hypothetical protein